MSKLPPAKPTNAIPSPVRWQRRIFYNEEGLILDSHRTKSHCIPYDVPLDVPATIREMEADWPSTSSRILFDFRKKGARLISVELPGVDAALASCRRYPKIGAPRIEEATQCLRRRANGDVCYVRVHAGNLQLRDLWHPAAVTQVAKNRRVELSSRGVGRHRRFGLQRRLCMNPKSGDSKHAEK
jgi:hypothetical protein